jgi:hypothetical protein
VYINFNKKYSSDNFDYTIICRHYSFYSKQSLELWFILSIVITDSKFSLASNNIYRRSGIITEKQIRQLLKTGFGGK